MTRSIRSSAYGVTLAQLAAMHNVTRPYHAPAFSWWAVTAALAAHLTLLLQQGQRLAGVEQSQVAQALCHHIPALLLCFAAIEQQLQDLHKVCYPLAHEVQILDIVKPLLAS